MDACAKIELRMLFNGRVEAVFALSAFDREALEQPCSEGILATLIVRKMLHAAQMN